MQLIIQAGVPRSGSTLVTQALEKLFPKATVLKIHGFRDVDTAVVTYRDFRDVLVSLWRVQKEIPLAELEQGKQMPKSDIEHFLPVVTKYVDDINRYKSLDNVLFLKYEQFYNDYDFLFDAFEQYFNVKLNSNLKKKIKKHISLEVNTRRAAKFPNFHSKRRHKMFARNNFRIHGLHIYSPKPGAWRDLIAPEHHELINNRLGKYLKQWGYEKA